MFEEFQLQSSDADQALLKVNISENQEDFVCLYSVNFFFFISRYFHLLCGNVGFQLSTSGKKCVDALEQTKAAEERSRV